MKPRTVKIMLAIPLIFLFNFCTKDFDEINFNPNLPVKVSATNVFGDGILTGASNLFGVRLNVYYAGMYSGQLAQIINGDYEHRIEIINSIWASQYNSMYSFSDAMRIAKDNGNDNLYAAALTMKAYMAHQTTDMWGPIPYTEAFKMETEEEVLFPIYDSQEKVYNTILDELKVASDMFQEGSGTIGEGDLILDGDLTKWKKFSNSVRLRVAIRMSSVDESAVSSVISEILNNPDNYPLMEDNEDNSYLWFPGDEPDLELWYRGMGSPSGTSPSNRYRTQNHLANVLKEYNDPRISVYLNTNEWGDYNGYKLGPEQHSDTMNNTRNVSPIGDRFTNDPAGFLPFMNCAEVYLNMAEAYARGLASGDARQAYETGITMSMEENGIEQADIDAYLAQPEVAWGDGSTSNLEKIYLQKWISLFKQSVEAWCELRRTDVPLIDNVAIEYVGAHNRPPLRLPYPNTEESRNENFPFEYQQEQKDIFWGIQLWWDTRTDVY